MYQLVYVYYIIWFSPGELIIFILEMKELQITKSRQLAKDSATIRAKGNLNPGGSTSED